MAEVISFCFLNIVQMLSYFYSLGVLCLLRKLDLFITFLPSFFGINALKLEPISLKGHNKVTCSRKYHEKLQMNYQFF